MKGTNSFIEIEILSSSRGIGVLWSLVAALWLSSAAFVILKLTDVIDWSWWLVTMPFWGGIALILGIFVIASVIYGILKAFGK